jgi:response regulator NasT
MNRTLRVVVADDERDTREYLQEMLTRLGHQAVAVGDGRQLVELCRSAPPDLILTDVRMPGGDGIDAAEAATRERPAPVILVTGHHGPDVLARVGTDHVMAYLVKPVSQADVEAAVAVAMMRFEQLQVLRKESADLRQALEDRKMIERAKGVVMRRLRWDEEEAFRRIRKLANDHNRKVVDVAAEIIRADSVFEAMERGG